MPSRQVAALIAAGGLLATAALLIIPIPLLLRLPAAALTAAVFFHRMRRTAELTGKNIAGGLIIRDNIGTVIVLNKDGHHAAIGKITNSFVSAWLSTAVINCGDRRYVALLMPDSLAADDYRQLRVWLARFSSGAQEAA